MSLPVFTYMNVRLHKFELKLLFRGWLILLPLLGVSGSWAQQSNEVRIDFSANQEALSVILDRLSQAAAVNFSYNSADPSFSVAITYQAKEKTVRQILSDILTISGHGYRQIGNQLVVFPEARALEIPDTLLEKPTEIHRVDTSSGEQLIVRDTIIQYETITRFDTLVIRDTIIIEKEVPRDRRPDLIKISQDIFRFEPNREDGWAISFHYGQYYGGFNTSASQNNSSLLAVVDNSESNSFRNFSLGSELLLNKNKWTFSAGIQLTGFATRIQYHDVQTVGGYFQTDTISWYYTVVQNDTSWIPVTDSTYLPLDRREVNYNQLNRLGYLDLMIGAAYTFYSNNNFSVFVNSKLGNSLLIYHNGILLQDAHDFPGQEYDPNDFKNSLLYYQFGAGMRYKAGNWFDIFSEFGARWYFESALNEYPIDKKYFMLGIKAGLIYYF